MCIVATVNTAVAQRSRTSALPILASIAFGLILGAATFLLHGLNQALDVVTNSTSTWIIWAAVAGALIPRRTQAMLCGAILMVATCAGYYATVAARSLFGAPGIPVALVWLVAGVIGGPILAWAAWSTRHATGVQRNLGVALIGMAVAGEGLWLGLVLHYWQTAAIFLTAGTLLTIALTIYRYRDAGRNAWLPMLYMPVLAFAYLAAEYVFLNQLMAAV